MKSNTYLPALTGVRAIAAFMVFFHHFNQASFPYPIYRVLNEFHTGVTVFFVLSGFLPRALGLLRWVDHLDEAGKKVYTTPFNWFYLHVCKNIATDLRIGSLVYALCMIAFYWTIVYFLDKKKIYIKV